MKYRPDCKIIIQILSKTPVLNNKILQNIVSNTMSHGAADEMVFEQTVNIRSYNLKLKIYGAK